MESYEKIGYLNTTNKLFYISDTSQKDIPLHYHDFHKILILISGSVNYFIEGKNYTLMPNDIVIIKAGKIHRPILSEDCEYERLILYVSNDFFTEDDDLSQLVNCFNDAKTEILRIKNLPVIIENSIAELKQEIIKPSFLSKAYQKSLIINTLVQINRLSLIQNEIIPSTSNKTILNVISYINDNLSTDLNISEIASNFYLNKSYLMHLFKKETGNTLNNYIIDKRLFAAKSLILNTNDNITNICFKCGFKSYSSFYRSYIAKYKNSPSQK